MGNIGSRVGGREKPSRCKSQPVCPTPRCSRPKLGMACAQKVFACGIDGQVGHCITPRHRWRQKMRTKFNMIMNYIGHLSEIY